MDVHLAKRQCLDFLLFYAGGDQSDFSVQIVVNLYQVVDYIVGHLSLNKSSLGSSLANTIELYLDRMRG